MVVVDTTPLNYLVQIGAVELLRRLYRTALIPGAVRAELTHPQAPEIVRAWISEPPEWLQIVTINRPVHPEMMRLDPGECEAILLASEVPDCLLLMDERDGVSVARQRGLRVIGTLAVLDLAAARGLADLQKMFDRLRETTFRSPLRVMAKMLEDDAHRKRGR